MNLVKQNKQSICMNISRRVKDRGPTNYFLCGVFLMWCKMIFSLAWNTMFTDYWKVLVLNFLGIRNTVFFWTKNWWKDDIYWFPKNSCFELFGDGKCVLFLSSNNGNFQWYSRTWEICFFCAMSTSNISFLKRFSVKLIKAFLF